MNTFPLQNIFQSQYNDSPILIMNQTMQDQQGRTLLTQALFRMIKPQLPQLPQNSRNLDLRFLLDMLPNELRQRALQPQQLPEFIAEPIGFIISFLQNKQQESNGATEDQIKNIKAIEINEQNVSEFQKDCCSICQDSFNKGQNAQILNCKHIFHENCLTQWLKVKAICPLCRADAINKSS